MGLVHCWGIIPSLGDQSIVGVEKPVRGTSPLLGDIFTLFRALPPGLVRIILMIMGLFPVLLASLIAFCLFLAGR